MLNKLGMVVVAVVLASSLSGCAGLAYANRPVIGAIGWYSDTQAAEAVTENAIGSKTGESCSQSILGIVTTGDASVAAAARAGGITRVATVDNKFKDILGIIATYCVVVSGD